MAWIYKIYNDEEYKLVAKGLVGQNGKVFNEIVFDTRSQEETDNLEAEYDDRFHQVYIVSCSGC